MICDNLSVNEQGHLVFAGRDTVALAHQYGTPLYVMDEDKIRQHVRCYKNAMKDFFPAGSVPEYASKAFSCKAIYRIMAEEEIDIDTVSAGEIYTAKQAGFPMENCFFHGNNKTDEDIGFAIENGVGWFIIDNLEEAEALNRIAAQKGITQKALLRLTPGIDPHTHKKISTGSTESKFGIPMITGDAEHAVGEVLSLKNIDLRGFHCHIGSQIFESEPFVLATDMMFSFIEKMGQCYGYTAEYLNLGGGFGIRYEETDPVIDFREKIREIASVLENKARDYHIPVPKILMEPGRSLVADAGLTLYTVGSVKEIEGYKNYVSVDGGMTDNPRYTLYEAVHRILLAERMKDACDFCATVAGRCCESGDMLGENVLLPKPVRGEILAVCTTGAYNYSMASNYNRIPRPPVVFLKDGKDTLAVKRESLADLCLNDL